MGFRFYRRVRILPGVSVNFSRSGPSLSVGLRGPQVTVGRSEMRKTVGIPGTASITHRSAAITAGFIRPITKDRWARRPARTVGGRLIWAILARSP
jgi:hypothetical protein